MDTKSQSSFLRYISRDFICYYMALGPLVIFTLTMVAYNDPEYGFTSGTLKYTPITIIFPIIWLTVYIFCKKRIYDQNMINQKKNSSNEAKI